MMTGGIEIDPVKYGVLWEKVQAMDKRVEKIEDKIDLLLELANRGKGGLWLGMAVIAVVSSLIGVVGALFRMKGH